MVSICPSCCSTGLNILDDFWNTKREKYLDRLRGLGFGVHFLLLNTSCLATWIRSWEAYFRISSCFLFPEQRFNYSEKNSLNNWVGKCMCSVIEGLPINFRLALQRLRSRPIILWNTAVFKTKPPPGLLHTMHCSPACPWPGFEAVCLSLHFLLQSVWLPWNVLSKGISLGHLVILNSPRLLCRSTNIGKMLLYSMQPKQKWAQSGQTNGKVCFRGENSVLYTK